MQHNFHHLLSDSKPTRILLHIVFWLIVALFFVALFSWNSEFREITIIFSAGLLPVAMVETYFFSYVLIPKYLWQKRYKKFFLFSFYTLLVVVWLSLMIVFYTLIFILNKKTSIVPSVLHPEWQIIAVHFIAFLAIAIKQIKRAFRIQQEKNELEKTKLTTELKLKEAELKLLKAQVHPHFLFNTLNNLYGLTLEKSDEAPELVLRLSEILDYILYRCNEQRVFLAEELSNLKNYIEIEKIRYSEKLEFHQHFPDNCKNMKIAPLLILPFIENAFKHGVSNFPGKAFVKITVLLMNSNIIVSIENSKNPVKNANTSHSKGIGLENVRKRLELMYPEKYILSIKEKETTFSVNLTLQLEN